MNRLKLLREEKQLSQLFMAQFLNVSVPAYSYYENEKRDMSTEIQKKLANFFDVSIDYLVGNSHERKKQINETDNILTDILIIPVIGKIRAGEPILARENIEDNFFISKSMYNIDNTEGKFFLKVIGNSMNNIISDGGYALMQQQSYAESGDIVVAIVNDDDEATLKKFKQLDENFVMLEPDSSFSEYQPMIINLKDTNFKILGKLIGIFKKW